MVPERTALDKFAVTDGKLIFENIGEGYGLAKGREYSIRWSTDNNNGEVTPLPHATGINVPAFPTNTHFLVAIIKALGGESSGDPIMVYIRRGSRGLEVVGIER